MKHKEFGSDFHECTDARFLLKNPDVSVFKNLSFSFFISGRAALYGLVREGIAKKGWKKIYFPSFYCHEVVEAIQELSIACKYYPYNPLEDTPLPKENFDDSEGTVFVDVLFFGLKRALLPQFHHIKILEDVSHSLLSLEVSTADYCFGSLRKELPVPVGGFCFSPKGLDIPFSESGTDGNSIAETKWRAMQLKRQYLTEGTGEKEAFRTLFITAEAAFGNSIQDIGLPDWVKEILFSLDVKEIIAAKKENLAKALSILTGVSINVNLDEKEGEGFGLFLVCDTSETRDALRTHLINRKIYPAILWPEQQRDLDLNLEKTTLFLHTDYRYTPNDMIFVCETLKDFFNA